MGIILLTVILFSFVNIKIKKIISDNPRCRKRTPAVYRQSVHSRSGPLDPRVLDGGRVHPGGLQLPQSRCRLQGVQANGRTSAEQERSEDPLCRFDLLSDKLLFRELDNVIK